MKLNHKIVSIFLIVAVFSFNLVLLPAQAEEGCHCDHPHGDGEFACFCGGLSKPTCDSQGPSLSKRQCGAEKHADDFYIPANDHPTLLSFEEVEYNPLISTLQLPDIRAVYSAVLVPVEQPPSIL